MFLPQLRRMTLHVAAVASACPPPPPPSTPGERWHVTEIGKESLTPASYSCWENSARYLLCGTFISENCVVPRMECGGTQTRRRFSFASRQTPQRSAKKKPAQASCPLCCFSFLLKTCVHSSSQSDRVLLKAIVLLLMRMRQ